MLLPGNSNRPLSSWRVHQKPLRRLSIVSFFPLFLTLSLHAPCLCTSIMSAAVRRRRPDDFQIHQDVPSTEDTEMNTDAAASREDEYADKEDQEQEQEQGQEQGQGNDQEDGEEPELDEDAEDEDESEEEEILDDDMRRLQDAFPGFRRKYKLIKRIGEGV